MQKDYEDLKISFVELSGLDILTMSSGDSSSTNDNDGTDIDDWGSGWGNNI